MKTKITCIVFCATCLFIVSCKKEIKRSAASPTAQLSQYQSQVAEVTREVARALDEVYVDPHAYDEVNAAIRSEYYADERVPLRELLFPSPHGLYNCEIFRLHKIDTGRFRRRFCEVILNGNYPKLKRELVPLLNRRSSPAVANNVLIDDSVPGIVSDKYPVSIYFPYSENFGTFVSDSFPPNSKMAIILRPTIVYTDRDDDAAPGRRPYFCSGAPNNTCYADVTVNDSYAETYATHIVAIGAAVNATAAKEPLKTELVTRAYHGWSRLSKQMDKLISFTGNGGGSEIKVCRINGFLKMTDEQVTDFAGDVITINYTRADIRKRRFKRVFSLWDPNWNYQDIEQVYAVYENDNVGSRTISGSLNTTLNLPGKIGKTEGEIGFKISVITQDEIITQRKFDRKSFLRDGLNNQGWGFVVDANDFLATNKDWPVYDGGAIWSYTFPYRIY